jgi:hypothetical protein
MISVPTAEPIADDPIVAIDTTNIVIIEPELVPVPVTVPVTVPVQQEQVPRKERGNLCALCGICSVCALTILCCLGLI